MRSTAIGSLGDPGTFDLADKSDPGYYIARAHHEMSMNLYALQTNGFLWQQIDQLDIQSERGNWETYVSDLATWFDNAVTAANEDGTVPAPPTPPTVPVLPIGESVMKIMIRIAIYILIKWLERKLNPNTEALEIARILKKAFIGNDGEDDFPLVELLGNTPLEIIISKFGDYQDVLYSDRPLV